MSKDTSWDEVTSNSEKIERIALALIELRLLEGRQAGQAGQAGRAGQGRQAGRQ